MDDLAKFTKCDVFTPDAIAKLMASKLHKRGTLLEPSVGTGKLLTHVDVSVYSKVDVYELKEEYLDQLQIPGLHKHVADFMKADVTTQYDNIIMNPPYIKVQDLSAEYRQFLKSTFDLVGLVDIYYAFILKCLQVLHDDGIFVCITPNSYLYNKSSLPLRKYLFDHALIQEIIDFKEKKVFDSVSVYCCITIFTKTPKTHLMYNEERIAYSDVVTHYSLFNLNTSKRTLQQCCKIKNGIATLRDRIYIHDVPLFDEPCWKPITTGPLLKSIIYPYDNGVLLPEDKFKQDNPLTYAYLVSHKDELALRDKGHKTYPAWYAYGRSQSIKYNDSLCIYIPCFLDPKALHLYSHQHVLHYSCLCIEPIGVDMEEIRRVLLNNVQFMMDNSSKRSAGWINVSSRMLYDIPLD